MFIEDIETQIAEYRLGYISCWLYLAKLSMFFFNILLFCLSKQKQLMFKWILQNHPYICPRVKEREFDEEGLCNYLHLHIVLTKT